MTPKPDPCGTIQIHKYQQKSQSLTVKILLALPETPQNTLVLNCSHGRLMVRGSMFIYWLSLLSWSCYENKKEQFKSSVRIEGQFSLFIHNEAAFGDCFGKSPTNLMRSKKYNNEHISHWDVLSKTVPLLVLYDFILFILKICVVVQLCFTMQLFFSRRRNILWKIMAGKNQAPPKSLLLAQTEDYIEYSRSGKVIKRMEKPKARCIYEEDIYLSNI
uniref:Pre-mRNA-splicing factor SLU7 domain-containing protein n=1 Tax=Glossina palpalis gambiensis TaxID=67801 RepID=A0A1B0ATY7_9MUSC